MLKQLSEEAKLGVCALIGLMLGIALCAWSDARSGTLPFDIHISSVEIGR